MVIQVFLRTITVLVSRNCWCHVLNLNCAANRILVNFSLRSSLAVTDSTSKFPRKKIQSSSMNSEQEKERKFFKIISRFFISKEFLFVAIFVNGKFTKCTTNQDLSLKNSSAIDLIIPAGSTMFIKRDKCNS